MEEDKHMSLEEQREFLEAVLETAETISAETRNRMQVQLEGIRALLASKDSPKEDDRADQG